MHREEKYVYDEKCEKNISVEGKTGSRKTSFFQKIGVSNVWYS